VWGSDHQSSAHCPTFAEPPCAHARVPGPVHGLKIMMGAASHLTKSWSSVLWCSGAALEVWVLFGCSRNAVWWSPPCRCMECMGACCMGARSWLTGCSADPPSLGCTAGFYSPCPLPEAAAIQPSVDGHLPAPPARRRVAAATWGAYIVSPPPFSWTLLLPCNLGCAPAVVGCQWCGVLTTRALLNVLLVLNRRAHTHVFWDLSMG
jgi:hypothetical protein